MAAELYVQLTFGGSLAKILMANAWTMDSNLKVLDVVALTEDLPDRGLRRGQVGTVVELLAPNVFEVEFSDDEGRTYASLALRSDQLLVLHYAPLQVA